MYKMVSSEELRPKPREYLLAKAMKLKALTESDVEGERDSANRLLADYMDKYNITWDEIDETQEKEYVLACKGEYHKRLLIQIVYQHIGGGHCYRMFTPDEHEEYDLLKIKCKPIDFMDIQLDWDFYWQKFEEELDIFYRAFVERNKLFPPENLQRDTDSNDNEDLTEEEIRKIKSMMNGIDSYTRHRGLVEHVEVNDNEESDLDQES